MHVTNVRLITRKILWCKGQQGKPVNGFWENPEYQWIC